MKRYLYALIPLGICVLALSFRLNNNPVTGAEQPEKYSALLKGKSVAVLANQTSLAGKDHLVDVFIKNGIDVKLIFAPEHGFREMADAGETINDGKDQVTGVPVISLYGKHNKPTKDDLKGIDVVVFDIQDVGTRFYTYISTLHYLLEACAENSVSCVVLDRPDPNGFYVDGNILDTAYRSFVGLDPVPVVHGMTVGEYALMLNGEGWLSNDLKCDLKVIPCKNYTHDTKYELPVKPSPNLPNQASVYLYPSLCFFEGTNVSVGRGTSFPFQVYGAPELPDKGFSFIPESVPGAKNPPFLGQECFGRDLRNAINEKIVPSPRLNLGWVIEAYNNFPEKDKFFTSYFDVLAGGPTLREQIISGKTAEEIRASWSEGLEKFKKIRSKYLLYK
jgi:uncharacterized protein YbbC (DUF1343 family)